MVDLKINDLFLLLFYSTLSSFCYAANFVFKLFFFVYLPVLVSVVLRAISLTTVSCDTAFCSF